jgi:hypothetical protein
VPSNTKVILLELGGLDVELFDTLLKSGELPNLRRFMGDSLVFSIKPYVPVQEGGRGDEMWVTLHSGLAPRVHGIGHASESQWLEGRYVWDYLVRNGFRVGLWCVPAVAHGEALSGWVLADCQSVEMLTKPRDLRGYASIVRQWGRSAGRLSRVRRAGDVLARIPWLLRRRLSLRTWAGIWSLLFIKGSGCGIPLRSVFVFDAINLDLVRWYMRHDSVDFVLVHLYGVQEIGWRQLFPSSAPAKGSSEEHRIRYPVRAVPEHRRTHGVLAQWRRVRSYLGGSGTSDTCRTGASAPFQGQTEGQANIPSDVMTAFRNLDKSFGLYERHVAKDLTMMVVAPTWQGERQSDANCTPPCPRNSTVDGEDSTPSASEGGRLGQNGILWIRTRGVDHRIFPEPINLEQVTPTLLNKFGVAVPEEMLGAPLPTGVSRPRKGERCSS